jgi:Holliday junction resolvase-like predicted endonuclease
MDKWELENCEHYVIVQKVKTLKTLKNYVIDGCNETHLKTFINTMVGNVKVFLYNPKDNTRNDLTSKFRTRSNEIVYYEKIRKAKAMYVAPYSGPPPEYYNFYYEEKGKYFPPLKFYMWGHVFKLHDEKISIIWDAGVCFGNLFVSSLERKKQLDTYGNEYENFVALKYEDNNYHVELNGIKRGVKDGGLDLIATKKDKIVLVQCKNWSLSNNYKINQKDLRAFIGDCYLYMKDRNLHGKTVAFHFIVSHNDILTKSADIFLKQNTFLKFKCVPFEK